MCVNNRLRPLNARRKASKARSAAPRIPYLLTMQQKNGSKTALGRMSPIAPTSCLNKGIKRPALQPKIALTGLGKMAGANSGDSAAGCWSRWRKKHQKGTCVLGNCLYSGFTNSTEANPMTIENQVPHKLCDESNGEGNMRSSTPVCSCGWRGIAQYAYNDDQLTNVRRQGERHLKAAQHTASVAPSTAKA